MAEQENDSEKQAGHSSDEGSSNNEDIDPPSTSDSSYNGTASCLVSTKQYIFATHNVMVIQNVQKITKKH